LIKKEALQSRKAAGKSLGRPPGKRAAKLKLDARKQEIQIYLDKGISKRSIAKLVDCAPSTLYYWLERHQLSKTKSH
jgi:DNA invertase Pin-like site-specific DNA recombinase